MFAHFFLAYGLTYAEAATSANEHCPPLKQQHTKRTLCVYAPC
jgi:hypothetical protein